MTDAERATATALAVWEHRALNMPRHPPDGHLRPETVRLEQAVTELAQERGTTTLVVREHVAARRRAGHTTDQAVLDHLPTES